uniref:Transmembrane protein n=1 Tax=Prymnesium polylepis TaxID=72548 RepID=A0A7S4M399_9EUKA
MTFASAASSASLVKKAAKQFKRLRPLDGALIDGGFPGAPVNPSMAVALAKEGPERATCYERVRDATLRWFIARQAFFLSLAMIIIVLFVIDILVIIVFVWGSMFGVGIIGRNSACDVNLSDPAVLVTSEETVTYPPMICVDVHADGSCGRSEYVADFCNLNQYMWNICIKVIMFLLTYINVLPIPWRVAIGIDAWGDVCLAHGKFEPPGVDFYDRPTEAMWFHIPRHRRALIALLLNLSYVGHISAVVCTVVYWEYIETQTWPGMFAINLPAMTSIITIITAAVLQGNAEAKLVAEQPERFPPPMIKYIKEAVREWRAGKSGKPLIATIRAHVADLDDLVEKSGGRKTQTLALTSIAVDNDRLTAAAGSSRALGAGVSGRGWNTGRSASRVHPTTSTTSTGTDGQADS